MAIISFWSDSKKPTGQTMSAVAIATYMAIEHNYKILFLTTKNDDDSLELCFGRQLKQESFLKKVTGKQVISLDSGIEGVVKMATSGRLTPEMIPNYTKIVYKNRLEILYGYKSHDISEDEQTKAKIREKFKSILQNATRYYDMIFIDLESGLEDELTKDLIQDSNIVVINVEQKINEINAFMELQKNQIFDKKSILNIGRFDRYSKYSLKNISRYVGIKKDIMAVPYNTLYFEAASEESVPDTFLRIRTADPEDSNGVFIAYLKQATDRIIYKIQELQLRG